MNWSCSKATIETPVHLSVSVFMINVAEAYLGTQDLLQYPLKKVKPVNNFVKTLNHWCLAGS